MKGYIYTLYKDADPGKGWTMTDPIWGSRPTLGACMPNIRRCVVPGDHIFAISGRTEGVQQFVVGGFEVDEKINALAAYSRFPEFRQRLTPDGTLLGNIIVDANGHHNAFDYHTNFEKRLDNYIVGKNPTSIASTTEIQLARDRSIDILKAIFSRSNATSIKDVIGRWRRMDADQVTELNFALRQIKAQAAALGARRA